MHNEDISISGRRQAVSESLPWTLRIADCHIDPASNRLRRGTLEIKLEPRVMALLLVLAARPGELVTREEIESTVWGNIVVGYDALTTTVNKLRKALGDQSRRPRYIETVSKRGYRLIATVSQEVGPSAAADSVVPIRQHTPGGLMLVGMALLTMISFSTLVERTPPLPTENHSQIPALAILPLTDLGASGQDRAFAAAMTAELTTALAKFSGLFLVSTASAFNDYHRLNNSQAIAREFGVRYVLKGNVQRSPARLRVTVQLLDVQRGAYLWAERYDRELSDVFVVQEDIANKIATTLSVRLSAEEKRRRATPYTSSVQAYDEFLSGQIKFARLTPGDNLEAREAFTRAIGRDPQFARAHGGIALTYVEEFRYGWTQDPATSISKAAWHANLAAEMDDQLPQVHRVLAYVHLHRHDYEKALASARRAVRLAPNDADSHVVLATINLYRGEADAAVPTIRRAMRLNPSYSARYASMLGQAYYHLNRYEEAISVFHDAIERNASLISPHVYLTLALSKLGRGEDAAWAAAQLRTIAPNFTADRILDLLPIRDTQLQGEIVQHFRRMGF